MCLQIWEHLVPTFDFPLVTGLKLGPLDLHLPHRLLDNNNMPLLGLIGPEKKEWQVTKRSDLPKTLPQRVLMRLSLVALWQRSELRQGLRRVANIGEERPLLHLSSPIWRATILLILKLWRPLGSSHHICSRCCDNGEHDPSKPRSQSEGQEREGSTRPIH